MPDNTNVNNSAAVTVVGRTAPVPPGQQKSDKSIPVVIASDQETIPVAEQNKVQSEVALSLLGIPRSEVALGIFADVNTYDVNPTEWASEPEQYGTYDDSGPAYSGIVGIQGHGLSHIPLESGALIEAPADKTAVLTSKRFFRYQPGRVSAATFGVKTTIVDDPGSKSNLTDTANYGSNNQVWVSSALADKHNNVVANPSVRKYGIFDKYDGYYWETRNNGKGDNFGVVRRTQSIQYMPKVDFGHQSTQQSQDYGIINPTDPKAARGSESKSSIRNILNTDQTPPTSDTIEEVGYLESEILPPGGFERTKPFGDLCVLRDNLLMVHGGVYDTSLLQPEFKTQISSVATVSGQSAFTFTPEVGLAVSFTNAVYDTNTGLMVVTTNGAHGFHDGQYLTLTGIGMTCEFSMANNYTLTQLQNAFPNSAGNNEDEKALYSEGNLIAYGDYDSLRSGKKPIDKYVKRYPNNNKEYNIVEVNSPTSFTINVGVSTVTTVYAGDKDFRPYDKSTDAGKVDSTNYADKIKSPGWAVALSVGQHVSYSKGSNGSAIGGLVDTQIFRVSDLDMSNLIVNGNVTVKLKTFDSSQTAVETNLTNVTTGTPTGVHYLTTPVPFIQPLKGEQIYQYNGASGQQVHHYGKNSVHTGIATETNKGTGTFPLLYKDPINENSKEGYIDTTLDLTIGATNGEFKEQVDQLNTYYNKWVNQNVAKDYWNVYEYRIPRSRFSGDRLDGLTDTLLYSDSVGINKPGDKVINTTTGSVTDDTSIWNLEFDKVTMYKIEFSWYGAVGALFLAYVPVSNGEARWVRVHHLRASNQLKVASLGNATLPITYMVYGGGNQDRFGYLNSKRQTLSDYTSASQHIVKYGASYYIDGGDRGTVKLFSHSTDNPVNVFGSKRNFTVGSAVGNITVPSQAKSGGANYPVDAGHFISYVPNATAVGTISGLSGGTGYADAGTNVATTVSPSGGTGLTVDFTASGGVISAVTINKTGTGYSINDTVTISTGGGNATFTVATFDGDSNIGIATNYYVGAKVITDNPLDQNIRIAYVSPTIDNNIRKCYLNAPLQAVPANGTTITIIPDRPTPLIGLKCRDFIQSSLGQSVRNRTQVYPTRMSTGSDDVVKVDFLKSPLFQTESKVTRSGAPGDDAPTISASVNIGKRGKPTKVTIPAVTYAGAHTWDNSNGGANIVKAYHQSNPGSSGFDTETTLTIDAGSPNHAHYNPASGILTIKVTQDITGWAASGNNERKLKINKESLGFKCTLDATAASPNGVVTKYYPRTTDPVWGGSTGTQSALITLSAEPNATDKLLTINVGVAAAEYIRDPGTGVYGWMRGYYKNSSPKLPISVLGYLENRGMKRQQDIETDGYYFSALNATSDDIVITSASDPDVKGLPFLAERNSTPTAGGVQYYSDNSFTLADLSSVKISEELRSPIPGSGTVVSSIFAPNSGENYDLSPFFDYNKEYLSFPLTDQIESLFMVGSSDSLYNSSTAHAAVSASLTWEEQ